MVVEGRRLERLGVKGGGVFNKKTTKRSGALHTYSTERWKMEGETRRRGDSTAAPSTTATAAGCGLRIDPTARSP
jgi:hypothetical protein